MGNILGVVLGSTVVGTGLTVLTNFISNRKKDQLVRITDERKEWRNKIRKICTDIEKVKWDTNGDWKNDMSTYLAQLEVNINPYGRCSEYDFEHDAHIWREIDNIKEVKDKMEFDNHKELLLFYLSLMLKEDWERSKREIYGYSRTIWEMTTFLGVNCAIGAYYVHFSGIGTYIDTVIGVALATILFYAIIRYMQSIHTGSTMRRKKLRVAFLIELIIYAMIIIVILSLVIIMIWIYLNEKAQSMWGWNIAIVLGVYAEGVMTCWNWVNDSLKKFMLTSYVVRNRENILNKDFQSIQDMYNKINDLEAYIVEHQMEVSKTKNYVLQLKNILKEYEVELNVAAKKFKKGDTVSDCKNYIDIQIEQKRVNNLRKKIDNYLQEGIGNKLFSVWKKILKLPIIIKLIFGKVKKFFWNELGGWY